MKRTTTAIAASIVASLCLSKQSLAEPSQPKKNVENVALVAMEPLQVRIYVEAIEISALEYAELMTTPSNVNNHTKLRTKLLEKAAKGKAKLLYNQSLVARSGEKATVESVREYIYPTEIEPAETIRPKKNDTPEQIAKFPILPPTPTAFETRNLGQTLEIEPTIGVEGKLVDLRLSPESVKHVDDHLLSEWKTKESTMKIKMPTFYTLRTNTSVTVVDGEFLMVNSYSPEKDGKPDHSRKVLFFVRAEILKSLLPK